MAQNPRLDKQLLTQMVGRWRPVHARSVGLKPHSRRIASLRGSRPWQKAFATMETLIDVPSFINNNSLTLARNPNSGFVARTRRSAGIAHVGPVRFALNAESGPGEFRRYMTNKMPNTDRRNLLRAGMAIVALPSTVLYFGCAPNPDATSRDNRGLSDTESNANDRTVDPPEKENILKIQYLEFVTPEVDAVCATYSAVHGVTFGASDPNLGGARTAKLADGGMLGVRAPMRDTEEPVVRPYMLVTDIEAAVAAAEKSGAEIAMPPMEIEGHGKFAIFIQNGIESGLWQH